LKRSHSAADRESIWIEFSEATAIDEIAQGCGMDPLAFRLKNYAEVEPISGKPMTQKSCT
jgi:CO/xanthine dehydrogenase Mo-binding subunit